MKLIDRTEAIRRHLIDHTEKHGELKHQKSVRPEKKLPDIRRMGRH